MDFKMDVNQILEQLAEGFGVAVDKLFPILYKQAIIDGVTNLLWVALLVALIVGYVKFIKYGIKKMKKGIENNEKRPYGKTTIEDYPELILPMIFLGIGAGIGVFIAAALISDSITAFFNTEYYMIDKILSKLQ